METRELVIIGGGSAGMAAALGAASQGTKDILIIEREKECGGILQQCIHNGFGLHTFKEELSGPAYAQRYKELVDEYSIDIMYESTVIHLANDKIIDVVSPTHGYQQIKAKAIILAMGCRERTSGAIDIRGSRPKGIYSAGTAQKYLNMDGYLVGKKVFILGSGDIGLIMARRMTLEGAKVLGVAELMPYSNGLARNVKQCLEDFDIPLYLSHTVSNIIGKDKLEKVVISKVDENRNIIPGSEMEFEVDTLLLSVGLIPENRISEEADIKLDPVTKGAIVDDQYMTSVEGIFACGNVLHVHDLVDFVSIEGKKAGIAASKYIKEGRKITTNLKNVADNGISYLVPQYITSTNEDIECMFRVRETAKHVTIVVSSGEFKKQIKKVAIAPAEMEKVVLKASELALMDREIRWEVVK